MTTSASEGKQTADELRAEYTELLLEVCNKRKVYPANCSSTLTKTIKAETSLLKRATVELTKSTEYSGSVFSEELPEVVKEELTKQVSATDKHKNKEAELSDDITRLSEKSRNIQTVLKQIKNESKDKTTEFLN